MWEPPGRGTEWRKNEWPIEEAQKDYNDMETYCGGKGVQWNQNGGKCGVCGDNWADPEPREHEDGGKFDTEIVSRTYLSGQVVELQPEVTANHYGFIEFRLCARNDRSTKLTQDCFQSLYNVKGEKQFNIGSAKGKLKFKIQLPAVKCEMCVIQWLYSAGNDWGDCGNGTSANGCSKTPEQFYACANVAII